MTTSISQRQASTAIRDRVEFKASALYGTTSRFVHSLGWLSPENCAAIRLAESQGVLDYVVYSYQTPLAWHTTDAGWVYPDAHYSPTTSARHNPHVRSAIGSQPEVCVQRVRRALDNYEYFASQGKRVKGLAAARHSLTRALAYLLATNVDTVSTERLTEAARVVGTVPTDWLRSFVTQ